METDCEEFIRIFWNSSTEALPQRLLYLANKLVAWGSTRNMQRKKVKKELELRLHELEMGDPDNDNLAEITDIKLGLNLEADKEERFWEQRSRVNWLLKGDKNTSFFHNFATSRKKNNTIEEIVDQNGRIVSSSEDILATASAYFSDLFQASTMGDTAAIFDNVRRSVSTDMNNDLLAPFVDAEVHAALRTMSPLKAPGLDGFPALFYQTYWSIVGKEVTEYCLSVLNGDLDISEINRTHIVLIPKSQGGMGFRDMSKFNVALLAKQGWRILTDPSSLLARVMKARYFPTTDFMNATLGASPSYTWRSIYCSRGLLEQGLGWRVGTGSAISVWNDTWLPGKGDGRVHQDINIHYPMVSDLILQDSATWNFTILHNLFDSNMVDRIGCIPLAQSKPIDELVWRIESIGIYTPRSGYKLLLETMSISRTMNNEPRFSAFYRLLWELNMPAKCKIFMWRLSKNFMPTFANLQHRHLQVRNTCPLCESAADTVAHMVFSCPIVLQILASVGLPPVPTIQNPDVSEDFIYWFIQLSKGYQLLLSITYWSVWYARNRLVHEGSACSILKSATFIRALFLELESVQKLPVPVQTTNAVKWVPPHGDIIKMNFDASFNSSLHSSVSGIVSRDSQGLLMAACTYPHTGIADSFAAEAKACERAVIFAVELGFRSVHVEGDSLTIIKKLNSPTLDKSEISPIIRDILSLKNSFDNITFSFVARSGNASTHEMAKLGRQFGEARYWIEEVPASVEQLILRERPI
ncbi:hypothetical protein GQ457_01G013830 [Hibiscus cannabinus]